MSVTAIQNQITALNDAQKPSQEDALRKAAVQFEAVLLNQLTSVLNNTSDDKNKLFGSDGGTDLAKKLFSEQLATAMAEAGGIGLTKTILAQFSKSNSKSTPGKTNTLSGALAAVKDIKNESLSPVLAQKNFDVSKLIDKTGKINPILDRLGKVNPNDAAIISTYENETKQDISNAKWREPFLDKLKGIDYTNPANHVKTNVPGISLAKPIEFQLPVKGRISSSFGNRFHPIDKRVKFHSGLDIAAQRGTPIKASADGIVTFSGKRGGYGNMVIIKHSDGKISRYAHADQLVVKRGQEVSAGQKIATVGSTGKATGPHLHFEIRESGSPIDPRKVFSNVLPN